MTEIRNYPKAGQAYIHRLRVFLDSRRKRIANAIDERPFRSFFVFLGILLALIIASNIIGNPKPVSDNPPRVTKDVQYYTIGNAPKMTLSAKVEKSGVITVTALSPGVVQYINPSVGTYVRAGDNLLGLSSNYQGGNSATLQRQLAAVQYHNAKETYELQKDIINKQKLLAEKGENVAGRMRDITEASIGETRALVDLNEQIIQSLMTTISELENTNVNGANDALILATRQMRVQFQAGVNMARQGLRLAEFNAGDENEPAQISTLQKETAIKQLELQEKMLGVGLEASRLQLAIAKVVEGMSYPAAPLSGTVQRVLVDVGQAVNPGTPLLVIAGDEAQGSTVAVAYVSGELARKISRVEESRIHINADTYYDAAPDFISTEAVSGSLYGVFFTVPSMYSALIPDAGYITVDIPVGYVQTGAAVPFIPIDSVYQTKNDNYVFVEKDGLAKSRSVTLGEVFGSFVEIRKGLGVSDRVILDRTVISGDRVSGKGQ
jgi:multidrug efflux pump subunit AcrA (membrane-fusion protein)